MCSLSVIQEEVLFPDPLANEEELHQTPMTGSTAASEVAVSPPALELDPVEEPGETVVNSSPKSLEGSRITVTEQRSGECTITEVREQGVMAEENPWDSNHGITMTEVVVADEQRKQNYEQSSDEVQDLINPVPMVSLSVLTFLERSILCLRLLPLTVGEIVNYRSTCWRFRKTLRPQRDLGPWRRWLPSASPSGEHFKTFGENCVKPPQLPQRNMVCSCW